MSAYYYDLPPELDRDLVADDRDERYEDPPDDTDAGWHAYQCRCPDCSEAAADDERKRRAEDALTGDA